MKYPAVKGVEIDEFPYFWMDDINSIEQFPEHLQPIIEIIGWPAMLKIMMMYEGEEVYMNILHDCFRDVWIARLRKDRKDSGLSFEELAHKYKTTVRHARRLCPDRRQTALFKQDSNPI